MKMSEDIDLKKECDVGTFYDAKYTGKSAGGT